MLNNIAGLHGGGTPPDLGSFEAIYTYTLTGDQSSVVFNVIPSTYKHLQVRCIARSNLSGSGNNIGMYLQCNSDTGSNYNWHELYGNGGGSAYAYGQADTGMNINPHSPRAGDTANAFAGNIIDILDYADTNKYKTVRSLAGNDTNGGGWMHLTSGLWRNTAAITTLTFTMESSSITQYSSFALYGIKG